MSFVEASRLNSFVKLRKANQKLNLLVHYFFAPTLLGDEGYASFVDCDFDELWSKEIEKRKEPINRSLIFPKFIDKHHI